MNSRVLLTVILGITAVLTLVFVIVIPGVERGGWAEVIGVIVFVILFAIADRWFRRARR